MIFSKGFMYRLGQRIKEAGERMGHVRILGVRIFRLWSGPVIGWGLWIKDRVLDCPVGEM